MSDTGLHIAVFRKGVLIHTGNPIPRGVLQEYDTVHLGIGVFDASMFAGVEHLLIKGAGDSRAVDPGTTFLGSLRRSDCSSAQRNNYIRGGETE